jgi:hypothetical protein
MEAHERWLGTDSVIGLVGNEIGHVRATGHGIAGEGVRIRCHLGGVPRANDEEPRKGRKQACSLYRFDDAG